MESKAAPFPGTVNWTHSMSPSVHNLLRLRSFALRDQVCSQALSSSSVSAITKDYDHIVGSCEMLQKYPEISAHCI